MAFRHTSLARRDMNLTSSYRPSPISRRDVSTGTHNMNEIGRDIHGVDRARQAAKRLKRGECPTCGNKLFKPYGLLGKKKMPLTIPDKVLDGRCLQCFPLDTREQLRVHGEQQVNGSPQIPRATAVCKVVSEEEDYFAENSRVPMVLTVSPDDATIVSAITVEHSFYSTNNYRDGDNQDHGGDRGGRRGESDFYADTLSTDEDGPMPPLPLHRPGPSDVVDRDTRPVLPRRRM